MWPIWELKIFGNSGFFKVMAVLSRYGFVDKYREYIMFWLSYMCDLAHGLIYFRGISEPSVSPSWS